MTMAEQTTTVRILDAACNRAGEGLRVVEDFVRFALDDRRLTRMAKEARHAVGRIATRLPAAGRLAARDTGHDVGTQLSTPSEQSRSDLSAVCAANLQRTLEALRSIEEFSKLIDSAPAEEAKQLRYVVYRLARAIGVQEESRRRLATTRLYVLADGGETPEAFTAYVRLLIAAGADAIQLRDKELTDRELVERGRRLVAATRGTSVVAIINDRPDIAVASAADGVHVGQDEFSIKDARSVVGPTALVGVSTHSRAEIEAAVEGGASYLGVGPVFASPTKKVASLAGLPLLGEAAAATRLPWFAIGGITRENLPQVLQAGGTRVAVQGAIASAADPAAATRTLKELLGAVELPTASSFCRPEPADRDTKGNQHARGDAARSASSGD
jgi:thiamine-phosphate pyrophosphorylase